MATPFSKQFQVPGAGSYTAPHAAAVFDSYLWLIGASGSSIAQTRLQVVDKSGDPLDIETDVTEAANWSTSKLAVPGVKDSATKARCGAAPLGDALHLVWNSSSEGGALRASRYTVSAGQPGWQQAVTLHPQGDPLHGGLVAIGDAAVSAVGVGDDTLIVACSNVHAWWAPGEPGTIYIGTFNVADIDQQNNTWPARSDIWGGPTPNPPFGPGYTFPPIGEAVAIDWFNADPRTTSAHNSSQPGAYLWVSLASPSPSVGTSLLLPLDTTTGAVDYSGALHATAPGGGAVVRDPAGRIRTYLSDPHAGAIDVETYSTFGAPDRTDPAHPLPPQPSQQLKLAGVSAQQPSAAFLTQFPKTPAQATYTDKYGKTFTGMEYPVYEFILYGGEHLLCQVDHFGTAQVFPDIDLGHPDAKGDTDAIISSGIIDGPIPIPAINLAKAEAPADFGSVTYSTTQTKSVDHSVSNSFLAGFKSAGESLKGWGPAWDISLQGGMGFLKTDGTTTSLSGGKPQEALLDPDTQQLDPHGNVWGTDAMFVWTAYRFLEFDADGNAVPVADGFDGAGHNQAPLFTTVSCYFGDGGPNPYVPYAVTPGDLDSYTPEGLNARMATLGLGENYFENVIEPNAYPFTEQEHYLTASWSRTGGSPMVYQATTTDFTETSWTLETELWAGVSGGEEASIFGMGEQESFSFLVGGSYSHEAKTSTTTETGWGVGTSDTFGPPPSDDPEAFDSYTFRIYLLPVPSSGAKLPPNYWVKELKAHLNDVPRFPGRLGQLDPNTIDENACAWKIVFVVTRYHKVNGETYDYSG